ncbi:MAG: hypothetical protein J2P48_21210 [Alphaproteobacteria bacterium]|nr:hypothetical protein [Alphaproteobacteria bacterium]
MAAGNTTSFTAGYLRYSEPLPFELIAQPGMRLFTDTTFAPAISQDIAAKSERDHYF